MTKLENTQSLRGPSWPIYDDLNISLPFITYKPEETEKGNEKTTRGNSPCLIMYDDFEFYSPEQLPQYRPFSNNSLELGSDEETKGS